MDLMYVARLSHSAHSRPFLSIFALEQVRHGERMMLVIIPWLNFDTWMSIVLNIPCISNKTAVVYRSLSTYR